MKKLKDGVFPYKVIVLTGIDGSGKTLYARKLVKALHEQGVKAKYVWLRFNHFFSKPLLAFCRLVGLTRYEFVGGHRLGYHEFYRFPPIAIAYIFLQWIDTLWSTFWKIYLPSRLLGQVVVCDRYLYDILVDLAVDTGKNNIFSSWIARIFLALLPKDSRVFLLMRDRGKILEVRPEICYDYTIEQRLKLYSRIVKDHRVEVINNNGSREETFEILKRSLGLC